MQYFIFRDKVTPVPVLATTMFPHGRTTVYLPQLQGGLGVIFSTYELDSKQEVGVKLVVLPIFPPVRDLLDGSGAMSAEAAVHLHESVLLYYLIGGLTCHFAATD